MNYTIEVSGMMCGHCEASVESSLLNVAGVTDADADHEAGTVSVTCSDSVSTDALSQAIESAGPGDKFKVTAVEAA